MKRQHDIALSIITMLSLVLSATAVSQTKTSTTNPPAKKSSPRVAKTIPTIKCTDPDSMVACKSFKQLVDARDKDLQDSLTGDKDSRERHFAYVCLRPKYDVFKIVDKYARVIDVFIQQQPDITAVVWGSVRFLIQVL